MFEHRDDALGRGWDDGQAVREPPPVQALLGVFEAADADAPRANAALPPRPAGAQLRFDLGLAASARAARALRGQPFEVAIHTCCPGELIEARAFETLHPVEFPVVLEEDQGRHGLRVEALRAGQIPVDFDCRETQAGAQAIGLVTRRLGEQAQCSVLSTGGIEGRQHQLAGLAVVLDEKQQFARHEDPPPTGKDSKCRARSWSIGCRKALVNLEEVGPRASLGAPSPGSCAATSGG